MGQVAIRVEGLGKRYRIGRAAAPYKTLRETLTSAVTRPFHGAQPGGRSGHSRDRGESSIWALSDVSFSVNAGEVVGVVGRNGAGKSTLLKVLSRITEPTTGRAEIHGRVGALLEVGTAFHPELTGRENVFLSGAIHGMRRAEIVRKFDEIVAFAEVEQFIDTAVKHYSSGMYMRLGFAVAAHLEPDILVVDEVLAVGDAAFQQKSHGKMNDVARHGRAVLFVSHNLAAISHLCERTMLIERGRIVQDGPTNEVVERYLSSLTNLAERPVSDRADRVGTGEVIVSSIELLDAAGQRVDFAVSGQELIVRVRYTSTRPGPLRNGQLTVRVERSGHVLFLLSTAVAGTRQLTFDGAGYVDFVIPELPLPGGEYYLTPVLQARGEWQDTVDSAHRMAVVDGDFFGTGRVAPTRLWQGVGALVRHEYRLDARTEALSSGDRVDRPGGEADTRPAGRTGVRA